MSTEKFCFKHAIPVGIKKNFMSAVAAKTLAAEIALWKNDWQKAYDYSSDIINRSGLSLKYHQE